MSHQAFVVSNRRNGVMALGWRSRAWRSRIAQAAYWYSRSSTPEGIGGIEHIDLASRPAKGGQGLA